MTEIFGVHGIVVALVALIVIGPKDLPKAMRLAGYWVGKARGVARNFRAGFDSMVREAELAEMEKKWREENERIMREHPAVPADPADDAGTEPAAAPPPAPVHVEKPVVSAAPSPSAPPHEPAPS